ncbi:hypothetical protein Daus18300_004290 [Diaporthe australafricana]|uniref:Uncharacterized protein n=1 Tax=Diaporthe australafricana TaxID=127596 RepID=A0ABR3XAT5_9PEZI
MVKIVVPSHYSRYIVTDADLANYLRSHFGEGHDFQIEHTNDLWQFESPGDLSDQQLMRMTREIIRRRPVASNKASGVGMEPPETPILKPSLKSPEGVFDHLIQQWSSAKSTAVQLRLLKDLGKHRPTTLSEAIDIGPTWQGWVQCEWELPSVAQQLPVSARQLGDSRSDDIQSRLGNFVTITGSRGVMECSTCAQFLKNMWGKSGTKALKALSRGVSLLEHDLTSSPGSDSSQNVEVHATDTHIVIRVGEDQPDAQSFINAVVWTCAAVRINPQGTADSGARSQLQMSKATQLLSLAGASLQSQALVYGLEQLTVCSDEGLGPQANCWTGLFNSGIVAFHRLERQWGNGLEISFDMMVHLSGVENVYHFEGGIILVGFFTALVPISYDKVTNIIQWHFEESQDMNRLRTSRCFLGWFARANILLGTRQLVVNSQNRLRWSTKTREHHQSLRREGFEATGQLGFTAGPINTALQLVSTWHFHSNVQHFYRHEQYSTALRLGRGNVAIIIDSESKQVWLVPMLSVALHLCHRYFQEADSSGQINNPLPFADPAPDGASEAARVLESGGDILVFGAAGDPDAESLRQLSLRINTNMLNTAGAREPSRNKTLFASELMAMVTEPGRGSPLKKIKAAADAESWVGLVERADFVGVCANIGHLIKPDSPSRDSCTCSTLPSDKYFLAAHMRCLDALSQREGDGSIENPLSKVCRLGDRLFWSTDKVYWTRCLFGCHKTIWNKEDKILQRISSKGKGKGKDVSGSNGQTVLRRKLPVNGVVVFGGDQSKSILQNWLEEYIIGRFV